LVQGRESLNRAVDGDIVAIELLPESKWTAPSEIVLEDKSDDPIDDNVEENETENLLNESSNLKEKTPTGKIVGIIKRKWRQYCGILQKNVLEGSTRHIFCPAERKIPRVRIETRQADKLYGQRIIVAIDQWPRHSRYPQGHFVRALGPLGDRETENEVLLIEHDVPHSKFSEEVLNCLPKLPWIISEQVNLILIQYQFPQIIEFFFFFTVQNVQSWLLKCIGLKLSSTSCRVSFSFFRVFRRLDLGLDFRRFVFLDIFCSNSRISSSILLSKYRFKEK
jgi:exoribonuclease R